MNRKTRNKQSSEEYEMRECLNYWRAYWSVELIGIGESLNTYQSCISSLQLLSKLCGQC